MEEQLESTLTERGRALEQSSSSKMRQIEKNTEKIQHDLNEARTTITTLNEALGVERGTKDQLQAELRYLQERGAIEAVKYMEDQGWGGATVGPIGSPLALEHPSTETTPDMGTPTVTCELVHQLAEVRAEMEVGANEDTVLHDSLVTMRECITASSTTDELCY